MEVRDMKRIYVNTALKSTTPKFGYNKDLFKKLSHKDSKDQEIDFGYYMKDIHKNFRLIVNNLNFIIDNNYVFFNYKENKFKIKLDGDFTLNRGKLKLTNEKGTKDFMKTLIENILSITINKINIDNINYQKGSRIKTSFYDNIDWNLSEKDFFSKYLGLVWKESAL
jgi:hypothetical protein